MAEPAQTIRPDPATGHVRRVWPGLARYLSIVYAVNEAVSNRPPPVVRPVRGELVASAQNARRVETPDHRFARSGQSTGRKQRGPAAQERFVSMQAQYAHPADQLAFDDGCAQPHPDHPVGDVLTPQVPRRSPRRRRSRSSSRPRNACGGLIRDGRAPMRLAHRSSCRRRRFGRGGRSVDDGPAATLLAWVPRTRTPARLNRSQRP
jgi:hypothetical protein